jgi:putative DNA primase/helicase
MIDPIQQFRDAMAENGLIPPEDVIGDGQIHRCDAEGKRGKHDGAYIYHPDGVPAGGFQNWGDGLGWRNWRADLGRSMSTAELDTLRSRMENDQKRRAENLEKARARARYKAKRIWANAEPVTDHDYLDAKGVGSHGLRVHKGLLVVPFRDSDKTLHTLQFITIGGEKRFLTNGPKAGNYHSFGNTVPESVVLLSEGYATAATIHEVTGLPTVMVGDAGNLRPVAESLHAKFPEAMIVVCGDDDHGKDDNPGRRKAIAAAAAVGGRAVFPDFGSDRPGWATDFNDLRQLQGDQVVREQVFEAINQPAPPSTPGPNGNKGVVQNQAVDAGWGAPQPFAARMTVMPYPESGFPLGIQSLISELVAYIKAPVSLIATSVLSILSVVGQALINVRRDEVLVGPVSLNSLTVANSGERKTMADSLLLKPVKEFDERHKVLGKQLMVDFIAEEESWKVKISGVKESILKASRAGKPTSEDERRLMKLVHERPVPPKIPHLRREDTNPEGLAKKLENEWPSAGVLSNEAGIVLGSPGLSKDNLTRSLALFNKLWDGGEYLSDRADGERCRHVTGARVTLGLMTQEETLKQFIARGMGLVRGTGFLSRFLIAHPDSRMGTRPYSPPPNGTPALQAFHDRVTKILDMPVPIGPTGGLEPVVLDLSPDAKNAWIRYHDEIEAELSSAGRYSDVPDVASKSAENAVRIAALLHLFQFGVTGEISFEDFDGASRIARWHLDESLRYLCGLTFPKAMSDAGRLEAWLVEELNRTSATSVAHTRVLQYGPSSIRNKAAILSAVQVLEDLGRAKFITIDQTKHIAVNPALLSPSPPSAA